MKTGFQRVACARFDGALLLHRMRPSFDTINHSYGLRTRFASLVVGGIICYCLVVSSAPVLSAQLSLDDAIQKAFTANPAVVVAQQQVNQSNAAVAAARAARHFQLTFVSTPSVSTANVYQPPPTSEVFTGIQDSVQVPIPVGSKTGTVIAQASSQLSASQAQYHSARRVLAAQVRGAYFNVLRAQGLLDSADQQLASAQQSLTNAQNRFKTGDVAELDVLQAQSPVALAQAGVVQAQAQLAMAQQSLNALIELPLDSQTSLVDVADQVPEAPPITLENARSFALQYSPDVESAIAAQAADQASLKAAQAYRDPSLSLQAIDTRSKDVTSFSSEDTLQAQLTLPLNDGGAGKAGIDSARAQLALADAQEMQATQTVLVNVSNAYLNATSAVSLLSAAQSARDSAQTTYDKTVLGYQNGLSPLVDVLSEQSALGQARIAYIQALYNATEARADFDALISPDDSGSSPSTAANSK